MAYTVTDDAVPPDVVASGSGPVVASGADSPWDVPAGAIEDGVSYTFTAVASDGTDSSAPTDSQLVYHDSCPDLNQIPAEERPTHIDIAYKIFDAGGPGQYAPTPIYMDEWVSPGDPPAPAPALFILHGGGWTYGCRRSRWHEAYTYSRPPYNFDVFGIDYRLACTGTEEHYHQDVLDLCGWPYQALDPGTGVNDVAAHDLEDAIGYLKDNASSFPAWDGQNIGALGSSAGGTVLLDAIADANSFGGSGNKPQVSATWSASMEMASMDQAPDDGFFSADGCDHARGYVTPLAQTPRDYMVDCWFATDRYLNSVNPDGTPRCGLTEVDGLLVPDPYVNHISRDSSDCEADLDAWWYSSPFRIWQAQQATETDYGPVFIANGGGDDAGTGVNNDTGDYAAAETVALEEPLEFYNWLRVNSWTSDNAHLCVVDTTMHGHKYEDMPCDDNLDSTVLTDTGDFFLAHLSS